MPSNFPYRPVPGQCGPRRRGPLPAPPFNPSDYWATRKWVSALTGDLDARVSGLERNAKPLAGSEFPLDRNEDLYAALSRIIPALGGTVKGTMQ